MVDIAEDCKTQEKHATGAYAAGVTYGRFMYEASYGRVLKNANRMHKLGQLYRKQTPPARRSLSAWLRFLKKHAPKMKGL